MFFGSSGCLMLHVDGVSKFCKFEAGYSLVAVSNEVPEHPVISPVSGAIFEKRLIEKYLVENGVDPINGKELSADMLIDVKS
jgi:hypothetical protein